MLERSARDKKGKQYQAVVDLAAAAGAAVEETDKHLLNQLCDNRPHQVRTLTASSGACITFKPADSSANQ